MRQWGRKRLYALAAAVAVTMAGGGAAAVSSAKTVILDVDGAKRTIRVWNTPSVAELLRQQGVAFSPQDVVAPVPGTRIEGSLQVVVIHGKRVRLQDGAGQEQEKVTHMPTVGMALKEWGISLKENDSVSPSVTASISPGELIRIMRRDQKVVVNEEKIPFQTERQSTDQLDQGTEKVLSPGVEGLQRVTTTIFYENGKEVDRKVERTVINPPSDRVVAVGVRARPVMLASRGVESFTGGTAFTVVATAYSGGGITATGHVPQRGTVAVDPSVIPLGTPLFIPGYGHGVADDVGGAVRGNRVDLYFPTEAEAQAFGRRTMTVYIGR
ncbi:3D domain-containing protein [Kyrpidia tusciae]|uniref:3D domain protein n=1 Tax=Kyrpidia tusciae (strain DSM 2912 / NBRC 15312 / T2) TaxID=562970 RepID=D5WUN8_KYRT2|nr:3D domain-containing protein [Kyrpidia tusciae]ADG05428.1 3D domain protein [Kyrpidia tusciae DSM 2912]